MTEDEMVGWYHQLNGHGLGWTLENPLDLEQNTDGSASSVLVQFSRSVMSNSL